MPSTPLHPPTPPALGDPLQAAPASEETLRFMAHRRSTPIKRLAAPGPSPAEVDAMLQLAGRTPDHRRLEPWRFLILEGSARVSFGEVLADAWRNDNPGAEDQTLDMERARPMRAPVCIIVVSSPDTGHKTPVWEQELSAGAACMNLLTAANAMGWAAAWVTEWCAYSDQVNATLGLETTERIAGFVYLGSSSDPVPERARPDMASKISRWTGYPLAR